MRNEQEIRKEIADIERANQHILVGGLAIIDINAPVALMQLSAESRLRELYWVLGETYESKLKRNEGE